MPLISLFRAQILVVLGGVLLVFCVQESTAQTPWQQNTPSESAEEEQNQSQSRPSQQSELLVHGLIVGGGLTVYQGDFSRNPNHNILKYLGTAKPSLRVGVDHRLGYYDQYGLGVDLAYSRVEGMTSGRIGFKNNMVSLDVYGDYELPYVKVGLFRVFVGGGGVLLLNPEYNNFPNNADGNSKWRPDLKTRVVGSVKVGVTILDKIRVGTRIASTDFLDGYVGYNKGGLTDIVSFISFNYRFGLK